MLEKKRTMIKYTKANKTIYENEMKLVSEFLFFGFKEKKQTNFFALHWAMLILWRDFWVFVSFFIVCFHAQSDTFLFWYYEKKTSYEIFVLDL